LQPTQNKQEQEILKVETGCSFDAVFLAMHMMENNIMALKMSRRVFFYFVNRLLLA